jgi:hypothetical protein
MITVTVPYNKIMLDGEVTFTLEWQKGIKACSFGPHEGDCFEVIEINGEWYDDDYPDLEMEAFSRAADRMNPND